MNPRGWDEFSEVIGIESPNRLRRRLLALAEDKPFLVCDSGVELIASSTRDLPPDESASFTPGPGGHWFVTDKAGDVIRLADWTDDNR